MTKKRKHEIEEVEDREVFTNEDSKRGKEPKKDPDIVEVYLDYDEHRSGGEAINPDEEWSNRTDEYIDFTPVSVSTCKDLCRSLWVETLEVPKEFLSLDFLYLLVARYESGDTFGRSHGNWNIVGVFDTATAASVVKRQIATETFTGYRPWEGYFDCLTSVEIERVDFWR